MTARKAAPAKKPVAVTVEEVKPEALPPAEPTPPAAVTVKESTPAPVEGKPKPLLDIVRERVGEKTDKTPNSHYSVAGVTAGLPVNDPRRTE